MALIKVESEDMRIEEAFRVKNEDTEEQQTEMAFIKEESEDMRIEETFRVKHEDTEEQTDNFEERRRKVREAEVRSDLQSDAEEPGRKKARLKKPSSRLVGSFLMDSEEDDALQQDSTGLPAAPPVQQFNPPTKEETLKTVSFTEMLTSNHTIWHPEDFAYESPQEPTRSLFPEGRVSWNRAHQPPKLSTSLNPEQPHQSQLDKHRRTHDRTPPPELIVSTQNPTRSLFPEGRVSWNRAQQPPEPSTSLNPVQPQSQKHQRTHQTPTPELIVSLIREMLTKQEMILDQQQSILRILNAKPLQDTDFVIEDGLLPVKDLQALKMLELKLQAVDFKEKLINHLGLIGGCDTKDTVWRTMQRTISNELAKNINWRGVNGKISLAALQIKDVLVGAVRKNVFSSRATNNEIENVMKRWLHLASDRDGGRKRRQKLI